LATIARYLWECQECGMRHTPPKDLTNHDIKEDYFESSIQWNKKKTFLVVKCPNCFTIATTVNFKNNSQTFPREF
jgi:hypothetical protein